MEAAEKMTIENFEAMSGEGAGAMFDVLGAEQVFESLGEVQVAGMFSAMDAEQMAALGTETIAEALTTMGTDNAVAMGADQNQLQPVHPAQDLLRKASAHATPHSYERE